MNNPAPRSPDERLTELSLMLGRGADACDKSFWLLTPLMVLIATWLRDMAESLATLAALIRDGKLLPQQAPAPCQGTSRPAGKPSQRTNRSPTQARPRPAAATAAQVRSPLAEEPAASQAPPPPAPQNPRTTAGVAAPLRRRHALAQRAPPAKNGPIQAGALARPKGCYFVTI